jgi:hypothetical protein
VFDHFENGEEKVGALRRCVDRRPVSLSFVDRYNVKEKIIHPTLLDCKCAVEEVEMRVSRKAHGGPTV